MQNKLRLIGVRPINNVVDITNYIVHAFGQPLHCFDAGKIKGDEVIVKTMPEGTPFVTLDEVERKLNERDLMICNKEEAMCIAGVFGGLDSGSTEATTDVFIESAYFHPTWVRKTARRHGLNTDASFRFERGIDPNGVIYCLKLAAIMVKELAGGTISSEIKDVFTAPAKDFVVELTEEAAGVRKVKSIALNAAGTKKMKEGAEAMPNNAVTTANKLISLSYYADGMAYYPVYIAHFGQGQTPWSESDYKDATIYGADSDARYLGRYGVVRNNWYDISVTSIKALGSPNVTEVTNEPVDKKESYILSLIHI